MMNKFIDHCVLLFPMSSKNTDGFNSVGFIQSTVYNRRLMYLVEDQNQIQTKVHDYLQQLIYKDAQQAFDVGLPILRLHNPDGFQGSVLVDTIELIDGAKSDGNETIYIPNIGSFTIYNHNEKAEVFRFLKRINEEQRQNITDLSIKDSLTVVSNESVHFELKRSFFNNAFVLRISNPKKEGK